MGLLPEDPGVIIMLYRVKKPECPTEYEKQWNPPKSWNRPE